MTGIIIPNSIEQISKRKYFTIGFLVCFIIIAVIFSVVRLKTNFLSNTQATGNGSVKRDPLLLVPPITDKDHYKWKSTSSDIKIVEYISLDCDHCVRSFMAVDDNKAKYENKFSLVYRHYPLTTPEPLVAEKTAIAECVYDLKGDAVMFEFIKSMFSKYTVLQKDNKWALDIASTFVDKKELSSCLEKPEIKSRVISFIQSARSIGLQGTPSLLIFDKDILVKRYDRVTTEQVLQIMNSYSQ
jgi:protein-disulfide isomerase